jgi:hypothetical protein
MFSRLTFLRSDPGVVLLKQPKRHDQILAQMPNTSRPNLLHKDQIDPEVFAIIALINLNGFVRMITKCI